MTGYAFAVSDCFGCGKIFTFNPVKVPSIRIEGTRRPICQSCVARVNPIRKANGLDAIIPMPGAYDECEEGELG